MDSERFARAWGERGPATTRIATTTKPAANVARTGRFHPGFRRRTSKRANMAAAADAATRLPKEPLAHRPNRPRAIVSADIPAANRLRESHTVPRMKGSVRTRKPANVFG